MNLLDFAMALLRLLFEFVSFKASQLNKCLPEVAKVGVQEMIFIYVFYKTYCFVMSFPSNNRYNLGIIN